MKSLFRWSATLGLVGGALLGPTFVGKLPALALTEDQIVQKLASVPVFVITNSDGLPLSRPIPAGQNGQNNGSSVTGVYLSQQEAQAFVTQLRNVKDKDPKLQELVRTLQVTPVPLGVIYKQVRENANKPDRLVFAFKPVQQQVDAALALLRQGGQQVAQFNGVPVFLVRFGPDKGYVSIKMPQDNKDVIPLFMGKEDAQGLLGQVKAKYPAADIQVVDVDSVIETMRTKNEQWLNQIVIVPVPESRAYIRSLVGQNGRGALPQGAPNQNRNQPARPTQGAPNQNRNQPVKP